MDVRCEKCQTEYELDEARLKPGGVTVKCTNCGHMFKIRKRSITNVGAPPPASPRTSLRATGNPGASDPRARTASSKPPAPGGTPRADSIFDEAPTERAGEGPTTPERQWLIRLENGDQKSCRELATLQQWIVGGVVTRESLISRTGKTWKRLGDIHELAQYFDIADEARTTREAKPTGKVETPRGTMLGVNQGPTAKAAGGTILPDDDDEVGRATAQYQGRSGRSTPPPLPPKVAPGAKTPPMGSHTAPPPAAAPAAPRRPITQPPPPPARKSGAATPAGPVPVVAAATAPPPMHAGLDGRSTGGWASEASRALGGSGGGGPSGPFGGKLAAIPDEPAFANSRVRGMDPESGFQTGKVTLIDDDDDLMPNRRGSRAGLWIVLMILAFGGAAAAGVYLFVIKKDKPNNQVAAGKTDAAVPVQTPDAMLTVTPLMDAIEEPISPLDAARGDLVADLEPRLRTAYQDLNGKDEPRTQAVRVLLGAAIVQALTDRAGLVSDKAEADKLRKEAKTLAVEVATAAARAHRAASEDVVANLAMAAGLRVQNKPAAAIKRYSEIARAKQDKDWGRDVAIADALLLARDGKLDEAKAAFAAIDQGEGKLETSNDVRSRFQLARIAFAQGKPAEAKPLVEQILAAQPEHAGARALAGKLDATVVRTDPLPPEDPKGSGATRPPDINVGGGESYDKLLARANQLADTNCTQAMAFYTKALEAKPNGVEALTGMGYCHIDAKQFASAFGKFRSALAISSRYEPALWGIAEAYQQQGRKEQAIEAYQRYLEVYPGTAKAQKQLERLGGGGSPNGSGAGSATPPTPTPPPTPPEPAGSGSG